VELIEKTNTLSANELNIVGCEGKWRKMDYGTGCLVNPVSKLKLTAKVELKGRRHPIRKQCTLGLLYGFRDLILDTNR
jgi:hypothetical protein